MDWDHITQIGLTALGSGGSSFLGAFLRFKQRLKVAEESLASLAAEGPKLRTELAALRTELTTTVAHYDATIKGWRLEFDSFKADLATEVQHRKEITEAVEKERHSRPDPLEDLRREVDRMKREIDRIKERSSRYVRSEVFDAFAKSQEDQWKEQTKALGRLEGILR